MQHLNRLRQVRDSVIAIMHTVPDLYLIRSDMNEPTSGIRIALDEDKAATMGIINEDLEQASRIALWRRLAGGLHLGRQLRAKDSDEERQD